MRNERTEMRVGDGRWAVPVGGRGLALVLAFALALMVIGSVRAEVSVTAALSASETRVGMPVQLQVRVEGTTNADLPRVLEIDGVDSARTGESVQVEMRNLQMRTSVVYNYTLLPLREGTFEIPAIEFEADGRVLRTEAMQLVVGAGSLQNQPGIGGGSGGASGQGATPGAGAGDAADAKLAYAEMLVPKETVYVGEVVPVEVRFYFNRAYGFRLLQEQPTFSGEGFTVEDLTDPQRSEQVIGGTEYTVISFQSAITAVKSGELEIPSVSLPALVRLPSRGPSGFEDLFENFFGGMGGMPGFADERQLEVRSDPARLQVKPLPKEGRPESFTGAIGDFAMEVGATPETAAAGDPVTLNVTLNGRGNFGAMGEPTLTGSAGWKLYPPTDKFEPADAVGFGGEKTYEFLMIAETAQTQTPGVEFSYFDPLKGAYETLVADPIPVVAEGRPAEPAAVATTGGEAAEQGGAAPEVAPEAAGRSGVLGRVTKRSFRSPVEGMGFVLLNVAGALVVVGVAAAAVMRRMRSGERARVGELARRERAQIDSMRRSGSDDGAFADAGVAALEVRATRLGVSGPREVPGAMGMSDEDTEAVEKLLDWADARKFAGGGIGVALSEAERSRVLTALEKLEKMR